MPEHNAMRMRINGVWIFFLACLCFCAFPALAESPPVIVVVGDSLTAGYGLAPEDAFPAKLQKRLNALGKVVLVENAGVSGDTTGGGAARLAWSAGPSADAVILSLGANDALRGLAPEQARANLAQMLEALRARKLPVLLAGMRAPPNMGPEYAADFDRIYPDLAREFEVLLYPFFLDGVAGDASLNQRDMLHPTAEGVEVMVARITPYVLELLSGL